MFPSQHFIYGGIFALILFFLFPQIGLIEAGIIFISSFLIDVDHYILYIFRKKDFNLKKAYDWFVKHGEKLKSLSRKQRNKVKGHICFLHGIEVLSVLFLLSFIWKFFLWIFIGFAFHLLLDYIEQFKYQDRFDRFSIIWDYFKFKKMDN